MTIRSPHPEVFIPAISLSDCILSRALDLGPKPALIDGLTGATLTYAQLGQASARVARALGDRGLKKGDVIAVCLPNGSEFAAALHGALMAGATVTTLSPMATAAEIAFQLRDSGARFLLAAPACLDTARAAARQCGVDQVFTPGGPADAFAGPSASLPEVGPDDLAVLPYSSGTTGLPKGVMLSHRNLVANLHQLQSLECISEADRVIAVLPFFHIYGLQVVLNLGLLAGATLVTLPRFDLAAFLGAVEAHRVTRAFLVPPIILALARQPIVDRYDLTSLRRVTSAAAPLSTDVATACAERLGCPVVQGYGMTEASPATHVVGLNETGAPGTVGHPLPGTECRLTDLVTGAELGPGDTGELWVRGPQTMMGYLNDPVATRLSIDAHGWLRTGDVCRADADGRFYVLDRVKELIKYKGYQVAPAELEAVLMTHPAVADVAVVPSPDDEAGEVPKAFVVLRGEAALEELIAFVTERVAPHKRVRRVETVKEIPRSPAGKVLRRALAGREPAP